MSDTDKVFYPNTIEQILGKPRDLSPEEIAEIAENAEKATGRFRNWMREKAKNVEGLSIEKFYEELALVRCILKRPDYYSHEVIQELNARNNELTSYLNKRPNFDKELRIAEKKNAVEADSILREHNYIEIIEDNLESGRTD